jgi:UDP-N-acetylenolpyruvoylglucosamine reductase
MQVFHTAGVPPSIGSTILANMGSTQNKRVALIKRVSAKNATNKTSKEKFRVDKMMKPPAR